MNIFLISNNINYFCSYIWLPSSSSFSPFSSLIASSSYSSSFCLFLFPYQLLSSSLSFLLSLMTNILFSFISFSLYALILGLIMAVVTMPLETAKNRMAFQKPDKVTGSCRLIFYLNSCRTHFYIIYEHHKIKTYFHNYFSWGIIRIAK